MIYLPYKIDRYDGAGIWFNSIWIDGNGTGYGPWRNGCGKCFGNLNGNSGIPNRLDFLKRNYKCLK